MEVGDQGRGLILEVGGQDRGLDMPLISALNVALNMALKDRGRGSNSVLKS